MQLCRLPDQSPRQHANADRRTQLVVILALLQTSDPRLCRIKDHSFRHSRWQCDLNFNVEFPPQHVLSKHIKNKEFAVGTEFVVDGVGECDIGHRRLPDKHRVDQTDGERFVVIAAEQHFEGIVDERINSNGHRHLAGRSSVVGR